jgi:glycerol-3-phosphate dehydrogenase (NAD(P)+)
VIAALGAGVMASALATPLCDNGHEVHLVGTHLDRDIIDTIQKTGRHPGLNLELPVQVTAYQLEDIAAAFEGADIVMSGVNSFGVEWASEHLAPHLRPGVPVLSVTKGLAASDNGDLRILPDVLAQHLSPALRAQIPWAAIVGPSIAGEVAVRRDSCLLFAGSDQPAVDMLARTFRTDRYHVWTTTDLVGAEVCAALKNCFAFGVGLAEGVLKARGESDSPYRNHNYEAALFAEGALETSRMVQVVGGSTETLLLLPSIGDMYVTSTGGRNVRVGRLVGEGMNFTAAWEALDRITLEGAAAIRVVGGALPKLTERGVIGAGEFPLLRHLHDVVSLEKRLDMPWSAFFGGEQVSSGA